MKKRDFEHISLARASYEQLLCAIAFQAVASSNDMLTDFIHDPSYVKNEGMPTAAKFDDTAVDFAVNIVPNMTSDARDEMVLGQERKEGESTLDFLLRCAVTHVLKYNPELRVLQYEPPQPNVVEAQKQHNIR